MNPSIGGRASGILEEGVKDLRVSGLRSEAATLVAIWDTCFGGCGFDLSQDEADEGAKISKFSFFSPDVPQLLLRQIAGKIREPILREEMRKLAAGMRDSVKTGKQSVSG